MKERPILFSAPMVRAMLDGRKTQTRRIANEFDHEHGKMDALLKRYPDQQGCPHGCLGDFLWVREAWRASSAHDDISPRDIPRCDAIEYAASPEHVLTGKTRPGIYMPRWASRITLEITGVRVERLQDIREQDAIAEGIERGKDFPGWYRGPLAGDCHGLKLSGKNFRIPTAFPKLAYRALWESINGADRWDANPWVWVIEFKRVVPA